MTPSTPTVLIPGLACSPRLFAEQLPGLWRFGTVMIADNRRGVTMDEIAGNILDEAPPRFALAGLSMGGYIALEIMRRAPDRVLRLALLDTSARADRPEQTERRNHQIALVEAGRYSEIPDMLLPLLVHEKRRDDTALQHVIRAMANECGPEAFITQQLAIRERPDARPGLAAIACPTLVMVGEGDVLTPPELAHELASLIGGAQLVVIPECGHLSTLEQPEAVTAALTEWLE
jgi:pimeloyl-ACP methyl ester carboxylesterase